MVRASPRPRAAAPRRGSARARTGSGVRTDSLAAGRTGPAGARGSFAGACAVARVERRDALQQRLGVRHLDVGEQRRRRCPLDDPAGVHHDDVVGVPGDDAEVVGDEHDAHVALAPLLADEGEDLRLHRDVEGGRRLVGEQQLRSTRQGDGDHHALAHAAGQLVRVLAHPPAGVGDAHVGEQRVRRSSRRRSRGMPRWTRSGSAICSPMRISGLSELIGSWKTIAIAVPHSSRSSLSGRPTSSSPSKRTDPLRITSGPESSPMIDRLSTVLPEPDSPTMPTDFAAAHRERHPVDGAHEPPRRAEVGDQVGRPRAAVGHQTAAERMSKRRASQSPMRLNDSTVRNSIRQGNTVAHQPVRHGVAILVDQLAPRRRRRFDAEPEERQRGLGGDEDAEPGEGDGEHRRDEVGEHFAADHPARRGAEAACREDVVGLAQAPACAP